MSSPTPGALRAAQTIFDDYMDEERVSAQDVQNIARIIDAETGTAALVEALKKCAYHISQSRVYKAGALSAKLNVDAARAALKVAGKGA